MVLPLFVEILDLEQVQELIPEISTILVNSTHKLVTEDVPLITRPLCNAESTVDQTKETLVLKLMLDAQDHHTRDHHSTRLVQNSLLVETLTVDTFGEKPEMVHGDH